MEEIKKKQYTHALKSCDNDKLQRLKIKKTNQINWPILIESIRMDQSGGHHHHIFMYVCKHFGQGYINELI